jgi:hypothetical protein
MEHGIRLTGYDWQPIAGGWSVILVWQADRPIERDYTTFVHLVNADPADDVVYAQSDHQPTWVTEWPTSRWTKDQPVWDGHRLSPQSGMPAGDFEIVVGLYDWQTLERVAVLDEFGQPGADSIRLGGLPGDGVDYVE